MRDTGWVKGRLTYEDGAYIERTRFPLGGFLYTAYVKTERHDCPVYTGNDFAAAETALDTRKGGASQ